MADAYSKIGWENSPSEKTPINMTNLNHMDEGIEKNRELISQLEGQIEGLDVRSITSIEKTSTEGLVDTYTIKFSDGTSQTYTVTNGDVSDAKIQQFITDWLDAHPEATTTVQDGTITLPKLADDVKEKIENAGAIKPLKVVNMGELFEQPETYLAWFQGTMKYDEDIGCPVAVISGKDAHTTGAGKCYFFKIEPTTGEVTLSVAGEYDEEDTYGCFSQSFYIDNDGNYHFYASIHESSGWSEVYLWKFTSNDKGTTWTHIDVTGEIVPDGSVIKLKSGRLIGLYWNATTNNTRAKVIYSDDNGENWTEGHAFTDSTEVEIIEMKDCLIAIGRKNLTYTAPLPALLYFSYDNGETWTSGVESTTITDMCNPCSGVYWEESDLLELFYCSRASNNGNTGTTYHAYAKLEDAKNDNFTVEEIGESKQTEVGIDFGYCATACDQKEKAWVIYYDHADSGSGVNLNLILADKTCVSLPVSDKTNSILTLWSAKQINDLVMSKYTELKTKINEIIIQGGGSVEDEMNGSMYITNGLYAYYDFSTLDNYDASTSKYSPVVGSGDGLVVNSYVDFTGKGDAHTSLNSGMAYMDVSGLVSESGDFTIEIVNYAGTWDGDANLIGVHDSVTFYNTNIQINKTAIIGSYLSAVAYHKENISLLEQSHIMLVYSASENKLYEYKNNVLNATAEGNNMKLDKYICALNMRFLRLRVYNKALSEEERANNYKYAIDNEM